VAASLAFRRAGDPRRLCGTHSGRSRDPEIDPTVHFSHNALAVVIAKKARIGARCQIGMHVLLGSRWPLDGGPPASRRTWWFTPAKIIGPITIGCGSVVGANAVVLADIPPHALAVGVPAIVKKTRIRIEDYQVPADDDVD
jgi:serine O-acetyltransferase